MNGYELVNRLRKARRRHPLTATEQALYHELVAICNDVDWDDVFTCSNDELCSSLNVSENTLNASRNSLINVGLIYYKSGKSKRKFGQYSFVKKLTTSKFEVNPDTNAATNPEVDAEVVPGVNPDTNAADYIETKRKTKTKPNTESGAKAPTPAKNSFKKFTEEEFKNEIRIANTDLKLPDKMLHHFFRYWSERSPSGLMKFQMEKTWETIRRLETWRDNQSKFERNGNKTNWGSNPVVAGVSGPGRSIVRDQL